MKVIIIGTGGHAAVVLDSMLIRSYYQVEGFLDDFIAAGTKSEWGIPVLGKIEDAGKFADCSVFVAVGDNKNRKNIVSRIDGSETNVVVIHPSATTGLRSTIGIGSFIASGANVGSRSTVGRFSIINNHANLDHDSRVGDFSHLAPGVVTGGHVTIGDNTFIGLGAIIRDRVKIGNNCTIGMGSVVLKDIPDNSLAYSEYNLFVLSLGEHHRRCRTQ